MTISLYSFLPTSCKNNVQCNKCTYIELNSAVTSKIVIHTHVVRTHIHTYVSMAYVTGMTVLFQGITYIYICSFQLNAVNLQVNCTIKDNISCCPIYLNHISGLHHLVTHLEQTEHMIHCSGVCCHSMCSVRGGGTHIATHIRFTCNTSINKSTLNWTLGTFLPCFPFRLSNSFHSRGIRMSVFETWQKALKQQTCCMLC